MIRIYKNQPRYCSLEIRSRKRLYGLWRIQKKHSKVEEPFHSAQEPLLVPKHLAVSGHPAWNLRLQHGLPIFSWKLGRCFREKRLTIGKKCINFKRTINPYSYCKSVHQLPGRFEQWTHRSHYRGKTQDAHWSSKGLVSSTSEHQAGPVSQTRCMVDMAARRMDNAGICHTPTRLTPRQSKHATQQRQMKQSNWFTMLLKPSTSTRAKLKQSERFQPC